MSIELSSLGRCARRAERYHRASPPIVVRIAVGVLAGSRAEKSDEVGEALLRYLSDATNLGSVGIRPANDVRIVDRVEREKSVIYRFALRSAGTDAQVLAKVSKRLGSRRAGALDRPRLSPLLHADERHEQEYRALVAVYEHFTSLGDERLASVRPLAHIPELRAVVVEEIEAPTLNEAVRWAARLTSSARVRAAERAFEDAGRWLRAFHQLELAVPLARSTRSSLVETFGSYADFLKHRTGMGRFFSKLVQRAESSAERVLPATLPLRVSHGDFAPRNVFVQPPRRLVGFDFTARWRTPLYEDLAYFVTALRTGRARRLERRILLSERQLSLLERRFLGGYFGGLPVPEGALAWYQLFLTLDAWSSRVARRTDTSPRRRAILASLDSRYFVAEIERLAAAAED